ncbi:MAG: transporter substrate-binding domain-containing protein [Burkholderiaceae bacterium]|nr:transporter substrate-binding domain-containing protein [Burkholderiaceae bacterium]
MKCFAALARFSAIVLFLCPLMAGAETLRVGFASGTPPYVIESEKRGLDYDIVVAAARNAGYEVEPFFAPRERLFRMLDNGDLDAISCVNADFHIQAYFSVPYLEFHNKAIALASRKLDIKSIADLKNYSISAFQRARYQLGPEFRKMAEANPNYREEPRQVTRNLRLYAGHVDVAIADQRIFEYFDHEVADLVDVHQALTWYTLFPPTHYAAAFKHADVRDRFDAGLAMLRKSGEFATIEKRYDSITQTASHVHP